MPKAKLRDRTCQECGKSYILGIDSTQHKYCSIKCRNSYHNKHGLVKYRNSEKGKLTSRSWRLRTNFNLSLGQYEHMLKTQENKCAICGVDEPSGYNWHVDHCHTTGKIRGLLCSCCNQGLGLFKENEKSLENAIKYLQKNRD